MARQKHGDAPKKKAARKKAGKKVAKAGSSLLERAAAKKRAKEAAGTMAPTLAPPSRDKHYNTDPPKVREGEHPVDTVAAATSKVRAKTGGPARMRPPVDREISQFRRGPLSLEVIDDTCRMLRNTFHRETVERSLGLSKGRIAKWIRAGKASRETIEAWHDRHDTMIIDGQTTEQVIEEIGSEPEWNMYALFHACVLEAEASGEQSAVSAIHNAAIGVDGLPPDWKAASWLLSRRYNKRWGSYAERSMVEEEDSVFGGEKTTKSATERLAETLEEMCSRRPSEPEE